MRERRTEMEREVAAGGFHSYRKLPTPNTISASASASASAVAEMNMGAGLHQISSNDVDNNNNNNQSSGCASDENECTVREQDRFMPIANVIRIMRRILPPHAKISDDAKETIQECVSEYISFITGEANDRCQREQRKTITAEDVLWAMSKLGFDDYIEPLSIYLHRYRELEGERASIRADPFLKRTSSTSAVDFSAFGIAAFAPATAFPHHHHHHGFFGAPTVTGYLKDASDDNTNNPASSSYNAMATGDAFAHHK